MEAQVELEVGVGVRCRAGAVHAIDERQTRRLGHHERDSVALGPVRQGPEVIGARGRDECEQFGGDGKPRQDDVGQAALFGECFRQLRRRDALLAQQCLTQTPVVLFLGGGDVRLRREPALDENFGQCLLLERMGHLTTSTI